MKNLAITENETVDATSETISLANNISVIIDGSADTINGSGGDIVTVNGNNNSITLPSTPISIFGGTIVGGDGSAILNGTNNVLKASDASVTLKNGASASLIGSNNSIIGTTENTVSIDGNSNSVTLGTEGNLKLSGGGTTVVAASHSTIGMSADDVMNLTGSNNTITGTNTISGTDDTFSITGNSNSITLGSGSGGRVFLYGSGNTVNGSGGSVFLETGDSVTINGTGDTIDGSAKATIEFLSTFNHEVMNDFNLSSGVIDFHGISKLNSFASVLEHAMQIGTGTAANVVISVGNDTLTLNGITKSSLAGHNFAFK